VRRSRRCGSCRPLPGGSRLRQHFAPFGCQAGMVRMSIAAGFRRWGWRRRTLPPVPR
jgi:hypothetical protein